MVHRDIFLVKMSYCAFSQGFFPSQIYFFVKRKSAAKDKRHCYYSLYCLFFLPGQEILQIDKWVCCRSNAVQTQPAGRLGAVRQPTTYETFTRSACLPMDHTISGYGDLRQTSKFTIFSSEIWKEFLRLARQKLKLLRCWRSLWDYEYIYIWGYFSTFLKL